MGPTIEQTRNFMTKIDLVLKGIAFARFQKGLCQNQDYEYSRIERCIDFHYTYGKIEKNYNIFALEFLKDNIDEILNGTKFNDLYIKEVKEPPQRIKKKK